MSHPTVEKKVTTRIPTRSGPYRLSLYLEEGNGKEHMALVKGDVADRDAVLVRIHSECFTGDVLGSQRCDCGDQLDQALERIAREGRGVIVYLRQEGRGIGLRKKLEAYNLQDLGYDTVDANRLLGHAPDERDYTLAARILEDLGIRSIRLLTNNPAKVDGLVEHGIEIRDRVPIRAEAKPENAAYLKTKAARLRHWLDPEALSELPNESTLRPPEIFSASAPEPAEGNGEEGGAHGPRIEELLAWPAPAPGAPERPRVTLTYAQSVDGCIAACRTRPLALSGAESLALTHELRAAHDAILVGIGTVLADDPRLTARLADARDPQPVVLDSRLRFPLGARLLETSRPWIAAAEDADRERQEALESAGARVLRLPAAEGGGIDLEALLRELASEGIASLMVEGGAEVIRSFLLSRQVDRLVVTIAPTLVGGLAAIARDGGSPALPRLRRPRYWRLGKDLVVSGAPEWS